VGISLIVGAAVCIGWLLGCAVQLQQAQLWSGQFYICFWLVVHVSTAMAAIKYRASLLRPASIRMATVRAVLLICVAATTGFATTGLRAVAFAAHALAPDLEGMNLLVTGVVSAMPQRSEAGLRFKLNVETAFQMDASSTSGRLDEPARVRHPQELPPTVYLSWYRQNQRNEELADDASAILQPGAADLHAGERWQMTVRLKAPHGNANPYGFDYELWMWEQGLQATGYVRDTLPNPALNTAEGVVPRMVGSTWRHPIERLRQWVRDAIFLKVPDTKLAGVIAALAVGDQAAIDRSDWDVYRATGVAHLMSISGLHITMFAWGAALCMGWLWRRSARAMHWLPAQHAALIGGVLLATAYALFSGWGVPSQRTVWMLATVALLRLSGKQWPWPMVWLLACAVVVAVDPWALLQAGFWLSFVAVGVLFATDSRASSPVPLSNGLANKMALGSSGELGSGREHGASREQGASEEHGLQAAGVSDGTPVAQHSRFARLRAHPFTQKLIGAAREQWLITLALAPLSLLLFQQVSLIGLLANAVAVPWVTLVVTPLALLGALWPALWTAAAWAVQLLGVVLQWFASSPFATFSVAASAGYIGAIAVFGSLLAVLRLPWPLRTMGAVMVLPALLWHTPRPDDGQFELMAVDIGQGNAVLVRTAHHSLLYDTGPRFSSESDAGQRTLVPLLRALGERLDTIIVSHRDSDHSGGALAVQAMQPQANLLSSLENEHDIITARDPKQATKHCQAGQHWQEDGVDFQILHPQAADYDVPNKPNAMSCVLRISNGQRTALLVADIEAPQEARLIADNAPLQADILLAPHHGSKTSSTDAFLDTVKPRIAIFQAGYRNRFHHPAPEVAQRYIDRHIHMVTSPQCGAATWRSDQPDAVTCQRTAHPHYWQHQIP
jgi:competence protein ComEC